MAAITLAPFLPEHVPQAVALSQQAGWQHSAEDWSMLLSMSDGIVALQSGQVVGTALRSDFGPHVSHISMVIAREDMRGQGVGRSVVSALLQPGRTLRLTATPLGRPLYESLGFRTMLSLGKYIGTVCKQVFPATGVGVASPSDLEQIIALENASYGGDRRALIRNLFDIAQLAVARDASGAVVAYAALRPFSDMLVLGPIVASDVKTAEKLIGYFANIAKGQTLRVDTYDPLELDPCLKQIGLQQIERCPVMQCGSDQPLNSRYGIFSQALG